LFFHIHVCTVESPLMDIDIFQGDMFLLYIFMSTEVYYYKVDR